jgi:hypothetical protein
MEECGIMCLIAQWLLVIPDFLYKLGDQRAFPCGEDGKYKSLVGLWSESTTLYGACE